MISFYFIKEYMWRSFKSYFFPGPLNIATVPEKVVKDTIEKMEKKSFDCKPSLNKSLSHKNLPPTTCTSYQSNSMLSSNTDLQPSVHGPTTNLPVRLVTHSFSEWCSISIFILR